MGKISRKEFFQTASGQDTPEDAGSGDRVYERDVNKKLPDFQRTTAASLSQYTGAWTETQAIYLIRRTMFGVSAAEMQQVLNRSFPLLPTFRQGPRGLGDPINESLEAGKQRICIRRNGWPAGDYVCRIQSGTIQQSARLVLE